MSDGDRPPSTLSDGASAIPPALSYHGSRILLGVALAILTFILFPAAPATDFPVYEVGSVASDNVIAPVAFTVLKTDKELQTERDAVADGVEPVYDFVQAALDSSRQALTGFMAAIGQAAKANPLVATASVQRAAETWGLPLSACQACYLAISTRLTAL